MTELLPCPFCGGEAELTGFNAPEYWVWCPSCKASTDAHTGKENAIEAWNTRAAMEFDNWFYLPKPKEPIVEVTETTNTWDGTKVRTDVFYQVREQAILNWAKELDEYIIKRICEVWNTRAERTCHIKVGDNAGWWECQSCGALFDMADALAAFAALGYRNKKLPNYCPNCGARVVGE